jgi:hypothetical protein
VDSVSDLLSVLEYYAAGDRRKAAHHPAAELVGLNENTSSMHQMGFLCGPDENLSRFFWRFSPCDCSAAEASSFHIVRPAHIGPVVQQEN